MATPRTGKRVVWTFWVTIETLAPTMRLTRVDLPAFGAPIMAAKPAFVWEVVSVIARACSTDGGSAVARGRFTQTT